MRTAILFLLLALVLSSPLRAQDTTAQKTRLERTAFVVGSTLAFSLADYVGYSLVRRDNHAPSWYRLMEGSVQAAISYFLYKECGLSSVVSFNLIWWTWGTDFEWYGWAYLLNPASHGSWENRSWNGLRDNPRITWAGWTPMGLLRKQGSDISLDALAWQSLIGFSISIAIL